jgi:hypothetical protein
MDRKNNCEYVLTLFSTKHDNISSIARVIGKVIDDMKVDDPWRGCREDTAALARALTTGYASFEFEADTVRFQTMQALNSARIIHKFEERKITQVGVES